MFGRPGRVVEDPHAIGALMEMVAVVAVGGVEAIEAGQQFHRRTGQGFAEGRHIDVDRTCADDQYVHQSPAAQVSMSRPSVWHP